jgi:hypothetical protein
MKFQDETQSEALNLSIADISFCKAAFPDQNYPAPPDIS